jgi:hypothetical protein
MFAMLAVLQCFLYKSKFAVGNIATLQTLEHYNDNFS